MIYLYNTVADTYRDLYRTPYESLEEFLSDFEEDSEIYKVVYLVSLSDVFEKAKQRSAFRGRFAKDAQGAGMLDSFMLTNDELSYINNIVQVCAAEVFKKVSAWCKNNVNAFQQNISFGNKIVNGSITSATGTTITDSSASFIVNGLTGYKIIILDSDSNIHEEERDIISNSETSIVIDRAFSEDPTGLEYGIYNPDEKYIAYFLNMDSNWDKNMLQNAEAAINEAYVTFILKEWYLVNRYMDDYTIEETKYQNELKKIRSSLMQGKTPYRRPVSNFP